METLFDYFFGDLREALLYDAKRYAPNEKNTNTINSKKNPVPKSKKTKLSPPWYTVYNKIKAMFEADPDITVQPMSGGDTEYTIYLDTPDSVKAVALEKILKTEYNFGNITVKVVIRVTNGPCKQVPNGTVYDNYLDALATTPAVVDIRHVVDMFGTKWVVIDFKKEVVQFYNDDLTDFYGNWNGLYTDIATDIFKYNPSVKFTIAVTDE